MVPGTLVTVLRRSLLKDPIEVALRGFRLSMRKADAASIAVDISENDAPDAITTAERPETLTKRPDEVAKPATAEPPNQRPRTQGRYRVALLGNPNTGKTTLYNALTGSRAQTGNYPGTTIERRVSRVELGPEKSVDLVDVPGTYSLTARSREEQVALEEICEQIDSSAGLDAAVVVLNATALSRSLYLLLQIKEFGIPVVAALNMTDEADRLGITIDAEGLSRHLGIRCVPIVARSRRGLDKLTDALNATLEDTADQRARPQPESLWQPEPDLKREVEQLVAMLSQDQSLPANKRTSAYALWCLMSLDSEDNLIGVPRSIRQATYSAQQRLRETSRDDFESAVVSGRYQAIAQALNGRLHVGGFSNKSAVRDPRTAAIDRVLTHPVAGLALFVLVMGLVFTAIFDWATPLMDLIDAGFSWTAATVQRVLPASLATALLANGIIKGVGSVVIFLPQILLLFLFLTLLEGSGYLARATFTIERLMRLVGLNGKAFVPLMSGYACAIPAVMATRTLESRRDRLITMMVIPLISCSARLPVYTLIIGTLFPAEQRVLGPLSLGAAMMLSLYFASLLLALLAAAVLSRTLLRGKKRPFLLELPPYRMPSPKTVMRVLAGKGWLFLKTAGTVILVASIILWALLALPRAKPPNTEATPDQIQSLQLANSYAGRAGKLIEPLLKPLGFDWKIGIGLIGSFAAREVFVATMGLVYGVGEVDPDQQSTLRQAMRRQARADGSPAYTPLVGMSLLVFFFFAMQCISTLAVVRQETRSWKWPAFMLLYLSGLGYLGSLLTYQIGRALGYT